MAPQRSISVIIPTKNQAKFLRLCLGSFLKQTVWPKEIIVIDNDSSDNTAQIISSFSGQLPIRYFLEKRPGPSFVRNRGVLEAKEKILAFIDSDCIPNKKWIESVWQSHIRMKKTIIQGSWSNILTNQSFSPTLYLFSLEVYRMLLITTSTFRPIKFIDTKNFSVSKELLLKNDLLFDTSMPLYAEDVDFGLRACQRNIPIIYNPKIKVRHLVEKDWLGYLKMRFDLGKSRSALEKKWKLQERKKIHELLDLEIWRNQRELFISKNREKVLRGILLKKNSIFSLCLSGGIKLGNFISYFSQRFD